MEKFQDEHLPLSIGDTQYVSDGPENRTFMLPIVNPSKYSSATGVKVEFLNIQPLPPLNNCASIPFPIQRFAEDKIDVIRPGSQLLFNVLRMIFDIDPWNFEIEFSEHFTPNNSFKPEDDDTQQAEEAIPELKRYCFTIGVLAHGRQEIRENFQLSFLIREDYSYDPTFSRIRRGD